MRALLAAVPQVALVLCLAVLATYGSVGAAQGLHVGWGWPVNVWRDLLENDSVLVALLDDKYVDHYQTCDRYGYCTDYYHYWITAGGEDWPVTQAAYDVLRDGEVVEIGYKPNTRFVLYVAYGPALELDSERERAARRGHPRSGRTLGLRRADPSGFQEADGLRRDVPPNGGRHLDRGAGARIGRPLRPGRGGQQPHRAAGAEDLVQDLSRDADLIPHEVIPSMLPLTQSGGRTLFFPFRPNVMVTYYDQPKVAQLVSDRPARGTASPPAQRSRTTETDSCCRAPEAHRAPRNSTSSCCRQGVIHSHSTVRRRSTRSSSCATAPYLDPHTANAKFDTMNTYLANGDAVVAPNWTFGVSEVVVKQHKSNLGVYPGWAGPREKDMSSVATSSPSPRAPNGAEQPSTCPNISCRSTSRPRWPTSCSGPRDAGRRLSRRTTTASPLLAGHQRGDGTRDSAPMLACWPQVENVLSRVWTAIVKGDASPTQVARATFRRDPPALRPCADRNVGTEPLPEQDADGRARGLRHHRRVTRRTSAIALGPDGNLWFTDTSSRTASARRMVHRPGQLPTVRSLDESRTTCGWVLSRI